MRQNIIFHLIVVLFHKASQSEPELLIRANAPVHTEQSPWCIVSIYLLSLAGRWHGYCLR